MTQLPPEPRASRDDRADEWNALLRGESVRPAVPNRTAPNAGEPAPVDAEGAREGAAPEPPAQRPLTRRERREAEQQRFAEAEAVRLIAEADVTPEASAQPEPSAQPEAFARPEASAQPEAFTPREARATAGAEPARVRTAEMELADLVNGTAVESETPHRTRPGRAERRAAASDQPDAEPRRRRRGPWGCLIALIVVVALGFGAFLFLQAPIAALIDRFTPAADYTGQGTGEVLFQVEAGDTGTSIAGRLVENDVVASEDAFIEAVEEAQTAVTFYPGVFRLAEQMSAQAALDGLTDESNRLENTVLIREGAWARDALAEVSAVLEIPMEELDAIAANPQALGLPAESTSLEGFLFPATYTFDPGATAQDVVQQMVDLSLRAYDEAGVPADQRYRVATIASLIEREGMPQDFTKISRVIQNRIDEGMLLQFDSTVHYGLADDTVVTTTDAERADANNAYNTYVHEGLPPGPIGNPGAEAIKAALNPEPGPWLYFVTVDPDTGETVFSETLAQHEAAAQRFYQWLEEHPGYGQ